MAISRMQNPRQMYGLGSLVKKAFRGVKKIVKSPIGKAALLGLGAYGLGGTQFLGGKGMFASGQGLQRFRNLANMGRVFGSMRGIPKGSPSIPGSKSWLGKAGSFLNPWSGGKFNPKKAFGLGAGALIAAPFLQKALGAGPYQDDEDEEELSWTQTPQSILDIRNMARNQDPSLAFMPSPDYVKSGFYNVADGGRVGLLNGGEAGEAQMEQMLRAEYIKYRNKGGTMPYEQFKILIMKQSQQGQMPNQMMEAGGRAGFKFGNVADKLSWASPGGAGFNLGKMAANKFQGTDFIEGPQDNLMASEPSGMSDAFDMYNDAIKNGTFEGTFDEFLDELERMNNKFSAVQEEDVQFVAQGGRAGYQGGELVGQETDFIQGPQGTNEFQETVVEGQEQPSREQLEALAMEIFQLPLEELDDQQLLVVYQEAMQGQPMEESVQEEDVQFAAKGGRIDDDEDDVLHQNKAMSMYRTGRQEGGLMDLGGQEKDYRENGGFVPLGGEERADDVPARLSKNEFVFTADAVRAAGGGDIDAGSEVMQNVMDNLEQGGEVSEDSQGLGGGEEIMSEEIIDESNPAQGMYDNYEQIQSRVA